MDVKAISKTIFRNLKIRIIGKSQYGNEQWGKADNSWYDDCLLYTSPSPRD